jgi:hypothetical protein
MSKLNSSLYTDYYGTREVQVQNILIRVCYFFNEVSNKCVSRINRSFITRSNEILGWAGVGNRQLLCFFKA